MKKGQRVWFVGYSSEWATSWSYMDGTLLHHNRRRQPNEVASVTVKTASGTEYVVPLAQVFNDPDSAWAMLLQWGRDKW